jgi:Complex 1 protein (LYR family)
MSGNFALYRSYYLTMYKMNIQAVNAWPNQNARSFMKERLRAGYREHRQERDPRRIEHLLHRAHAVLQATVPKD